MHFASNLKKNSKFKEKKKNQKTKKQHKTNKTKPTVNAKI